MKTTIILQSLFNGLVLGCAYALVALGFGLIYNTTRVFHFAHGAVYAAAAYIFYVLRAVCDFSFAEALIITVALTALLGVLVDEVVYYPLVRRNSSLLILMLSSLGVYIVVVNFIALVSGSATRLMKQEAQPVYAVGPLVITWTQAATFAAAAAAVAGLSALLHWSRLGVMIRAMRDDPELLATIGVNPKQVRRIVFALGSALTAVAAALMGFDVGIDPHIGSSVFLYAATAVIIGGVGFFFGSALGAVLLGAVQGVVVLSISSRWQDTVTFALLIFFLLYRTEGLLAAGRRAEEGV